MSDTLEDTCEELTAAIRALKAIRPELSIDQPNLTAEIWCENYIRSRVQHGLLQREYASAIDETVCCGRKLQHCECPHSGSVQERFDNLKKEAEGLLHGQIK